MSKTEDRQAFLSDLEFHRREWAIQRIGWAAIAIFIVLALAGMFGGGPFSDASVSSPSAGTIEYERYTRHGASTLLTITPAAGNVRDGHVRVAISHAYLQEHEIVKITPQPLRASTAKDALVYEFNAANGQSSIFFYLEPEKIGRHTARITIGDAAPLTLRQLTYP